jgi:hypothetical protein
MISLMMMFLFLNTFIFKLSFDEQRRSINGRTSILQHLVIIIIDFCKLFLALILSLFFLALLDAMIYTYCRRNCFMHFCF